MKNETGKCKEKSVINQLAPKRMMYFVLLIITISITIAFGMIPQENTWFTVGTGIGCGGIASTIVAWLIDEANHKRDMKRISVNREILFERLSSSFSNGLQILILNVKQHVQDDIPRTWYEWIDSSHQITESIPEYSKKHIISMRLFFDEITEQMYQLDTQNAVMLEHNLIEKKDIEALSTVLSICDLVKYEFNTAMDEAKLTRSIKTYCGVIKGAIEYSANLKFINDMIIEPRLYTMSKR